MLFLEFLAKGGPLMYPLLFCSIVSLALSLERFFHYYKAEGDKSFYGKVRTLLQQGYYDQAAELARAQPGPVAAIVAAAVASHEQGSAAMEDLISAAGSLELQRLNRHLHILELIGRVAPLIGLLGTVMGMVEAFKNLAGVKGAVDPSILAGGIWEALITTVAGLCVAIPTLVSHHFFEDKVKSWAFRMKHCGKEMVRLMGGRCG